jgi:hypothetical protein
MGRECIWVLLIEAGVALGFALPELALWRAGCVAIVGRGTEGALFAAVTNEAVFDED